MLPSNAELGLASTSFLGAALGRRSSPVNGGSAENARNVMDLPPVPGADTSIQFLERCHGFGAAGVQMQITGDPHALRRRAEELGMWIEAMISVRNSTPEALGNAIAQAKAAGCTVVRDGLLGGRRYETFRSLDEWKVWVAESLRKLETALPLFEEHKITLALENHKDWTLDEYLGLFRTHSSEYFGACLDFGNNLSLLDDPEETIEAIAPYARATHVKDIAVSSYRDGFLLSEVPLGTGILDLPRAIERLRSANPHIRLSLEMITRDPLKVPCLLDSYWTTFPDRNGSYLARTLRYIDAHRSEQPLPHPEAQTAEEHAGSEDENIRACFRYWEQPA